MNLLPEFHELLREAHNASEEADLFDVHSENPESREEWDRLRAVELEAKSKLISYVKDHAEELIPQLTKLAERS